MSLWKLSELSSATRNIGYITMSDRWRDIVNGKAENPLCRPDKMSKRKIKDFFREQITYYDKCKARRDKLAHPNNQPVLVSRSGKAGSTVAGD